MCEVCKKTKFVFILYLLVQMIRGDFLFTWSIFFRLLPQTIEVIQSSVQERGK